jgi:DNA-directed RNA polymerase specialized sigma subunit
MAFGAKNAYKVCARRGGHGRRMFDAYRDILRDFEPLSLSEERRLLRKAKKGSRTCAEELILRHVGFVIFRLRRRLSPAMLHRCGEDLLSETIPILYRKIQTYRLDYRDKRGELRPVKFSSYIWKRIDGFITDTIRDEWARRVGPQR